MYLFHYNRNDFNFDYDIFSNMFVPSRWKNNAASHVVFLCLPQLIEKWYGCHLDKLYIGDYPCPDNVFKYWDKLMEDSNAFLAFEKANKKKT